MKIWTLVAALALTLTGLGADAARVGGGKSVGKQSGNVTQRDSASPAAPAQGAAKPGAVPAPGAAAAKRPWGAMLGTLAAGLGIAWLAHSLGLGEAFGQVLMFAMFALAAMLALGWFLRRRRMQPALGPGGQLAFQGAGGPPITESKPYRPENVGNDASARPWERASTMGALEPMGNGPTSRSMIGSALAGSQGWGIPPDFDTDGFLNAARNNFVAMQAAWDKSDVNVLRSMMTDGMLEEIKIQLKEREVHTGGPVNHTDVVMIDAKLLGIEDLGSDYMASVEFSGMIREDQSSGPSPFREVWNMTKPKSGSSGWLVAGVQALQ